MVSDATTCLVNLDFRVSKEGPVTFGGMEDIVRKVGNEPLIRMYFLRHF